MVDLAFAPSARSLQALLLSTTWGNIKIVQDGRLMNVDDFRIEIQLMLIDGMTQVGLHVLIGVIGEAGGERIRTVKPVVTDGEYPTTTTMWLR